MGKTKWIAIWILLAACSVSAQQAPGVEISAGYSFLRLGGSGQSQQGVSVSVTGNVNNWLGIVGDLGGYHNSPNGGTLTTNTFLFGPRFSARKGRVAPFVQMLVGGAHLHAAANGETAGTTPFALSVGGGAQFELFKHFALRPQVDYIGMRSGGQTGNSARVSLGLVFPFHER